MEGGGPVPPIETQQACLHEIEKDFEVVKGDIAEQALCRISGIQGRHGCLG